MTITVNETEAEKTLQAYITVLAHCITELENKTHCTFEAAWPILSRHYYNAINERNIDTLRFVHGVVVALLQGDK